MSDDKPTGDAPKRPKLRIKFAEGILEGRYVNLAMTSHGALEFVLDFAFVPPGMPEAKVVSRVIMNPVNAKRFHQSLGENIRRYEERFGQINVKVAGSDTILH